MGEDVTAIDCVRDFIAAWNRKDLDQIIGLLHEDVFYHNIPMQPIRGRAAVRAYLGKIGEFEEINWILLHIAADGDVVLTERIDEFRLKDRHISLPIMGTFEIEGGLIRAWRDYFDLGDYKRQLYE